VQITSLAGGVQVRVSPCDETVFTKLVSYTTVIQTCMKGFAPKRGKKKAVEEEGEVEEEEEEVIA
jgi:hypothetical protein